MLSQHGFKGTNAGESSMSQAMGHAPHPLRPYLTVIVFPLGGMIFLIWQMRRHSTKEVKSFSQATQPSGQDSNSATVSWNSPWSYAFLRDPITSLLGMLELLPHPCLMQQHRRVLCLPFAFPLCRNTKGCMKNSNY